MNVAAHRFSTADFYRMAETGILHDDHRVELLDGEITDMMPIGEYHASVVDDLVELFSEQRRQRYRVRVQNPLRLDDHTLVQPDVVLLHRDPDRPRTLAPGPEEALLVVEVADSSISFDQRTKLPLYARAGIEEVWIVNIPERQIEVYREPNFLNYASTTFVKAGQSISPAGLADVVVAAGELFR